MRRADPRRKGKAPALSIYNARRFRLDGFGGVRYSHRQVGDMLQGVAADCNSAGATRAWFDSRIAHHFIPNQVLRPRNCPVRRTGGTQIMQLSTYLSTSRHSIFYLRLPIPAALPSQGKRSDIRFSLETRSPGLARQLSHLLVCAG